MSEALLEKESVKRSFTDAPESAGVGLPEWYAEARGAAWDEFLGLPMPVRTDEEWRFADLKKLDFDAFVDASEVDDATAADLITRSTALQENAGRIVFANERLIADPLLAEEFAEKGVIFKPLSKALEENEDLVSLAFMREPAQLGGAKFAALHRAPQATLHPRRASIERQRR